MSFANAHILPNLGQWFGPLTGRDFYNKKAVTDAENESLKALGVLEQHLKTQTFLVGERLTLADIYSVGNLHRGFQFLFGSDFRAHHPNLVRWYSTVVDQPIYSSVIEKTPFISEPVKYTPPKKEAAPKKEKAAAQPKAPKAPKAKEVEQEEEDEPVEKPKAKHPLESLPKPTLVLDDWKRKYSNEETREVALPWFWENYKPEEYSIWRVDYKYNDELTLTFMTSNLIGKSFIWESDKVLQLTYIKGGFFTRLEGSRKYIFGAASVYGQTNDSVVQGAFVIRGQDAVPAFDVAPDFESYEFTKLDHTKAEDREYVDDQWSWDKPVTVAGKTYEWADGKVDSPLILMK
jgi:elongation factor 1-gamma